MLNVNKLAKQVLAGHPSSVLLSGLSSQDIQTVLAEVARIHQEVASELPPVQETNY